MKRASRAPWHRAGAAVLLALFGLGLLSPAEAVRIREQENPAGSDEEPQWKEQEVAPPPYPIPSNLIEFVPFGRTTNRYYIDGPSLSVATDNVVRFTVVTRSKFGAETVSFSGVNCKTEEWKDYAYGSPDKTWRKQSDPRWRRIENLATNNYQRSLFEEFLCYGGMRSGGPAGSAKLIVRNLKNPPVRDTRTGVKY